MRTPVNVFAYVAPNGERYVFLWSEENTADVLCKVGQFAAHPELSLTWREAAKICTAIRKQVEASRTP
jgi:hypothetical protein